jgi:hypothetical protein
VRDVLTTREKPQQRASLSGDVIADGPAQHWVPRFQCIENRLSCHWTVNFEFYVSRDASERAQMCR